MILNEIEKRLAEIESEKAELLKLRESLIIVPGKIVGWNVTQSGNYYRLFKWIDKKKIGIHHGKEWNDKKARQQIRRKEQELGHKWTKEQTAIDYIQRNEPKRQGYFLGFSGGKDSIVLMDLARKSGVKFTPYYSATGIDPPEVVRFIREHYSEVRWLRPEMSFWNGLVKKGYPTKQNRWCCDMLKELPANKISLHRRLVGIRAEESFKRASRNQTSKLDGYSHYKPLFRWNEADIWEYIESNNLKYPVLYDEGWNRVGCVVCPFITNKNQAQVNRNRNRWPGQYKTFEHAMYRLWEDRKWWTSRVKGRYQLFPDFLQAWYRGFE